MLDKIVLKVASYVGTGFLGATVMGMIIDHYYGYHAFIALALSLTMVVLPLVVLWRESVMEAVEEGDDEDDNDEIEIIVDLEDE